MKKLLLLTNITCLCVFTISCQNSQTTKSNSENVNDSTSLFVKKNLVSDSARVLNVSSANTSGETSTSAIKDSSKRSTNSPHAIIHSSPDQNRLDSIKNAKMKGKKK